MDYSFLLPNVNLAAIVPALILVIVGVVLAALGTELSFIPIIGSTARKAGLVLIGMGLVYWFAYSWAQDILANARTVTFIIAGIVLLGAALLLFLPRGKKGRRR